MASAEKHFIEYLVRSARYRHSRYRYRCRTELTEVFGTAIDVVPNLPKCPVPVLMLYRNYRSVRYPYESLYRVPVPVSMSYRTYRSVWYRYWCRTELTEVSGTGINVVPNLPKCPVPVLMYQTYPSIQYWYKCRTKLPKCPVPVLMSYRTYRSVRYR